MLYWIAMGIVAFMFVRLALGAFDASKSIRLLSGWHQTISTIGAIVFFGGLANFLVFWAVAATIGGDAWSGKIEDGRYFLSSHGRYTEVSEGTYMYSHWHAISAWTSLPLSMIGMFLLPPGAESRA